MHESFGFNQRSRLSSSQNEIKILRSKINYFTWRKDDFVKPF